MKSETPLAIIKSKVHLDSVVYTDHGEGYDALDVTELIQ